MKQLLFIAIFAISFVLMQAQEGHQTQVRKIGTFDKVKATKGINVTLVEGEKESVEVHIENGNLDDVITDIDKKQLTVKMKTKIYKGMAVQVYVTYKTLRTIEASSGASIDADNTIYADKLELSAGSDASIELDVDVNAIEASVSAARIELSGVAKSQVITASTGGKYYAFPTSSEEVVANANMGGQIQVNVTGSIIASSGSGANITYKGDPSKVDKKESMGGKVQEN